MFKELVYHVICTADLLFCDSLFIALISSVVKRLVDRMGKNFHFLWLGGVSEGNGETLGCDELPFNSKNGR